MTKRLIVLTLLLIACVQSSLSWNQRSPRDLGTLMKTFKEQPMKENKENFNGITKLAEMAENDSPTNSSTEMLFSKLSEQTVELPANKTKRQTVIKGNRNRLNNLINLPVRLKVLANVLSEINQGVVANPEKPLSQKTIIGNDNTVSNLVNLPVDVDAVVNVLSSINISKATAENGKPSAGGVVGGLLGGSGLVGGLLGNTLGTGGESDSGLVGGLLGGEGKDSDSGLVDGLLGNTLGGVVGNDGLVGGLVGNTLDSVAGNDGLLGDLLANALGDTLGDTLGELMGALLGNDAMVGKVVGTVGGQGLVNGLLEGVLGAVINLVDNLLHLLEGLLAGLSNGMSYANVTTTTHPVTGTRGATSSGGGVHIEGNNNVVSSLINAPIRINALINILSTLRQELSGNTIAGGSASRSGTIIKGDNNKISSLVNLPLNADLNLNVLSDVTQTLLGKHPSKSETEQPVNEKPAHPGSTPAGNDHSGIGHPGSAQPSSKSTSIVGNGNTISNLLNVVPDVNLNLNLLSQITELLGGRESESDPTEVCFDIPISQADTSIIGNNNKISNAVNLAPKINLDLNLLSSIRRTGGTIPAHVPTQRVCIKKPPTEPITTKKPSTATPVTIKPPIITTEKPSPMTPVTVEPPTEICFDVVEPIPDSGTVIEGNNNKISQLVNVAPKLNLGLNLLSNVKETASASKLSIKRICIPIDPTPKPPVTVTPTTSKPVIPYSTPHPDKRCFRRTCTNWKQFVDYNCMSQPAQYPIYTLTQNL